MEFVFFSEYFMSHSVSPIQNVAAQSETLCRTFAGFICEYMCVFICLHACTSVCLRVCVTSHAMRLAGVRVCRFGSGVGDAR